MSERIYNNIKELNNKFEEIKNLGWIKSMRTGTTGIGYTFEQLLNCEENSFILPDYMNIEIKVKRRYSKGSITLFSANPDGDYLFALEHVVDKFGYPDKDFPEFKVFRTSICNSYNSRFKLFVSYEKQKVYMIVYKNNVVDECIVSWSFDLIKERLYLKLSYLALVRADVKIIDDTEFFKYYSINFYKLRGIDTFLKLIEYGVIRISFKVGIIKKGEDIGKRISRGTSFDINIDSLLMLFEEMHNV